MSSRSPTAATPLLRSSAPNTPAVIKETPTISQAVPFPPPQTFDFIPPLHGLIRRLLSPQTAAEGVTNDATGGNDGAGSSSAVPGHGQSQQQQPTSAVNTEGNSAGLLAAGPGAPSTAAEMTALGSNFPPPLDIKDLPTEVSSIKIRIQKAQAVVEGLPDVQRTVADQEREIHDLENQIAKLKAVISDFGRRANNGSLEKVQSHGS